MTTRSKPCYQSGTEVFYVHVPDVRFRIMASYPAGKMAEMFEDGGLIHRKTNKTKHRTFSQEQIGLITNFTDAAKKRDDTFMHFATYIIEPIEVTKCSDGSWIKAELPRGVEPHYFVIESDLIQCDLLE